MTLKTTYKLLRRWCTLRYYVSINGGLQVEMRINTGCTHTTIRKDLVKPSLLKRHKQLIAVTASGALLITDARINIDWQEQVVCLGQTTCTSILGKQPTLMGSSHPRTIRWKTWCLHMEKKEGKRLPWHPEAKQRISKMVKTNKLWRRKQLSELPPF